MNSDANIKQFQLLKIINENCSDEHIISKITIVLRRDKIEAPYYMISKIKLSSCIDRPDNGLFHAMDMLNHNRKYNLTEDAYNEIKSLIIDKGQSQITETDKQLNMTLMSKNDEEMKNLFKNYGELFDKIDNLID
ncbi:hypothetical protein [Methanobrevibacter sp.]|uniref:hypothetical protein n=1 Tax=Methanobrevibacter sp. TaxID=66852 RepID=UPI00388D61FF